MSYIINKTDGNVLVTLLDGTTNSDTGLTLIGKNYVTYGEIQNENFIRLLENFSADSPPGISVGFTPLQGQLWWDKNNQLLKVFDTAGNWIPVSQRAISSTAPATTAVGDQWWNTTTDQLSVWSGTSWLQVGPVYSSTQGKTGTFAETVLDTLAVNHVVAVTYVAGNIVSITSNSAFNVYGPISSIIPSIQPGVNIASTSQFNGTATDSIRIGGTYANVLARINTTNTFAETIAFSKNIRLTNANIYYSNQTLTLQNDSYNGDVAIYVNGMQGNVTALKVSGSTGRITVAGAPTDVNHISTKKYVDDVATGLQNNIDLSYAALVGDIAQIAADTDGKIAVVVASTNANLASATATLNANISSLSLSTDNRFLGTNNAIAGVQGQVTSISNALLLVAPINSPTFTGTPTVAGALLTAGTNTTQIATTAFVKQQTDITYADYTTKINNIAISTAAAVVAATAPKAPAANPTFTGTVSAPTATALDNSDKVATTAFVQSAITATKFNYTVSSDAPSGGNNGDFWFRVG